MILEQLILIVIVSMILGGVIGWYIKRIDRPITSPPIQPVSEKREQIQRSVIRGQIAEQLFPIMPECEFSPSDMRFFGDFCDYIVCDGYSDVKDRERIDIDRVVFVEIKTGKSRLSAHQNAVKRAIEEKRVEWRTIRLS